MSKSYREIMEHVKVTDEMHSRIMDNISDRYAAADIKRKPTGKVISFRSWKIIATMAACAAVIVICVSVLPGVISQNPGEPGGDVLMNPYANIVECGSVAELAASAGFEVKEVGAIPFEASSVKYEWCWDQTAQITYTGTVDGVEKSIEHRKILGSDDPSGDYNEYDHVEDIDVNGIAVRLKGTGDNCIVAVWMNADTASSIFVSDGVSFDEMLEMVKTVVE